MTELFPEPQWIKCRFNKWDRRFYAYENPFEPVKVGDMVNVRTPDGPRQAVEVMVIDVPKPPFKCKQVERVNNET